MKISKAVTESMKKYAGDDTGWFNVMACDIIERGLHYSEDSPEYRMILGLGRNGDARIIKTELQDLARMKLCSDPTIKDRRYWQKLTVYRD